MKSTDKRGLGRPFAIAFALLVTPIAFGGPTEAPVKIANLCAESGKCCFEPGSFCGRNNMDYFSAAGKCPPMDNEIADW